MLDSITDQRETEEEIHSQFEFPNGPIIDLNE